MPPEKAVELIQKELHEPAPCSTDTKNVVARLVGLEVALSKRRKPIANPKKLLDALQRKIARVTSSPVRARHIVAN